MIGHYDIATGEEVGEALRDGPLESLQHVAQTPAPRLMTVRESALRADDTRVPACIATLPVETILAKWS